ncbi:exonuclease domain-containing protein, partial [Staphylococcus simulans]
EIIVAHNAHFDMSVLATTLKDYNLELPKFKYIDSVLIFRKFLRNKSVSMENLCNYYNLPKENLHSAKKDTETLAILLKNLAIENEYKSISDLIFLKNQSYIRFSEELRPTTSFMNSKNSFQKAARLSEINNVNVINANNEKLSGKNIVFTGNFNEGKEFLQIMARENNANVRGTVNKNTNYLVEGKQELRFTDENGFVSKQRTARKLIQDGINIILLNEEQFLEMIGESYND